ncbi:MAG: hypothetical protein JWQ81_6153 [Amycolatopsis sp.]|uniref:hypothetical protein n=1 Tax=Amycolatopsis sp. TaxID=37632 RepID=UPI00262D330C|nr:hypothetical protein [Amycolatopsis sp.]MCU1685414.1 hypothetical protein [Amycolatopsis sp.]
MGQALNTTVNGSSGTCIAAADWLHTVADAGHHAAGCVRSANTTAEAGWQGPASQAFADAINHVDVVSDEMATWASNTERGLRDFASSLDAVVAQMQDALTKAAAGKLAVQGPFIVEPDPVAMPQPGTPAKVCMANNVVGIVGTYQGDIKVYNGLVADYNAKIAVYNTCKAIVDAARTTEGNAHDALQQALQPPPEGPQINAYKLGNTTISRVNGYIKSFENPRMENLLKAGRAETNAQFFEGWANGALTTLSADDKGLLQWAADNSRGNKFGYEARAQEYGKYVATVPQGVRDLISAYPGKGKYAMLPADAGIELQAGQKLLKGLPYVGSLLTIGTEAFGAYKGEQTWAHAAASTGGVIGGGILGAAGASAAAGAIYGSPLGPVGSFVVGTAGGIAGAIGGQAVVDWLVPH